MKSATKFLIIIKLSKKFTSELDPKDTIQHIYLPIIILKGTYIICLYKLYTIIGNEKMCLRAGEQRPKQKQIHHLFERNMLSPPRHTHAQTDSPSNPQSARVPERTFSHPSPLTTRFIHLMIKQVVFLREMLSAENTVMIFLRFMDGFLMSNHMMSFSESSIARRAPGGNQTNGLEI